MGISLHVSKGQVENKGSITDATLQLCNNAGHRTTILKHQISVIHIMT